MFSLIPRVVAHLDPALLARVAGGLGGLPLPALRARTRRQGRARIELLGDAPTREALESDARAAARAHAVFLAETLAWLGGREPIVDGIDPRLRLRAPRGRLFVTLHRGNWLAAGGALAAATGELHTVAGVQLHRAFSRAVVERLRAQGVIVHPGGAARETLGRVLEEGGQVVLHLDGDPRREGRRARVPRGRSNGALRGVARLAAESGAEVVFALCRREEPGRFRLEARWLTPPEPVTGREWERTLHELLHAEVARHPEEWMIFRGPAEVR
ncbi:MAG: hypothetical protein U0527_12895 [Candidatus Eisenbacteria bacterium]